MSVPTPAATGSLTAVSGGGAAPATGSVVQIELKQFEQQVQLILSGTYAGQQVVVEAQDPGGLAPWYGVRVLRQDSGQLLWGSTPIPVPDNPQGANPATSVVAAVEGAGRVRVRSVVFGSGAVQAVLLAGSFFASSPVLVSNSSSGTSAPTLLKTLRAVERLLSLQSGAWVAAGSDDGLGNLVTVDPSLGDTVG